MAELHETLMGRKLIEHDIPEIAKQLKRIADSMDKIYQEKEEQKEKIEKGLQNIQYLKSIRLDDDISFSTRVKNTFDGKFNDNGNLNQINIRTLYDLVKTNEQTLKNSRGFGYKCLTEINNFLKFFYILYLATR